MYVVVLQWQHLLLVLLCPRNRILILTGRPPDQVISKIFFNVEIRLLVISIGGCSLNFVRLPITVVNSIRVLSHDF